MMPKAGTDTGKDVTINIRKASGTLVIGDSASVINHFHDCVSQPPAAGSSIQIETLIGEVAISRAVDPRSVREELAKVFDVGDFSLIPADQLADAADILAQWREEGIKEAIDTVMETIGRLDGEAEGS